MAKSKQAIKVAVDSCVLINRFTADQPQFAAGTESLFHDVARGAVQLFGSTLLLVEVLGGRFSDLPDSAKESQIVGLLSDPRRITLVQTTFQVGVVARALRSKYHLAVADAVHLASAIFVGADVFATTNTKDFPVGDSVNGVRIELPRSPTGADVLPPAQD